MTDRHRGYVVTLEKDIREDDGESTLAAIRQIRGVISVKPIIGDMNEILSDERARRDLGQKLWDVLYPKEKS